MQAPNNLWIVLCNLQNFHNRSTLLFLWRSGNNNWFLTYRKLSDLLLFPHPLAFLIMSIHHLTFDGSAFIRAAFLVARPLFNLSPTFQGTHEEVAALLNLAHLYMVSPFLFLNLSLLSFLTFRWPIWVCSMLVAKKGIATIESAKPSTIFTWACRQHLWTLTGINGRLKPLRLEFDTPWCTYYFFLSLSYLILFLMIERMEFVRFRHLLAQPYRTCKVAGCRGHTTLPFVYSWSSNPIQRVSAHTCCLSCCAGPLWTWYPGIAASSISCQVAACHPPSHGKSFNQWFLCYSLFNYFLGCLQARFPAGLLSSGLRHSHLQVPL